VSSAVGVTSHGRTVVGTAGWGIGAVAAGFAVAYLGAWLDGRIWCAGLALEAGGLFLLARRRWLPGIVVIVGSLVGFLGYFLWLPLALDQAGVLD